MESGLQCVIDWIALRPVDMLALSAVTPQQLPVDKAGLVKKNHTPATTCSKAIPCLWNNINIQPCEQRTPHLNINQLKPLAQLALQIRTNSEHCGISYLVCNPRNPGEALLPLQQMRESGGGEVEPCCHTA